MKSSKRPKNMPHLMCSKVNPELFVKLNRPEKNVDARKAAVAVGHAMSATMADKSASYQDTTQQGPGPGDKTTRSLRVQHQEVVFQQR